MIIRSILLGAGFLLATGNATAHDENVPAEGSGYLTSGNNVVTTALDSCLRSGTWSEDTQLNACEGIEEMAEEAVETVEVAEAADTETPVETTAKVELQSLSGEALFATDSAELGNGGRQSIEALLSDLATFKNIIAITVTGHTDSVGSDAYNQDLSTRRAQTVASLITERFPDAPVTVIGLGESDPIGNNDTEAGRLMNRRVNVSVEASRMVFN